MLQMLGTKYIRHGRAWQNCPSCSSSKWVSTLSDVMPKNAAKQIIVAVTRGFGAADSEETNRLSVIAMVTPIAANSIAVQASKTIEMMGGHIA